MSFSVLNLKERCVSPPIKELLEINLQKISPEYFKEIIHTINDSDKKQILLNRWYNDRSPGITCSMSYHERLKDSV